MTATSKQPLEANLATIAKYFGLGEVWDFQSTPGASLTFLATTDHGNHFFKFLIDTALDEVKHGLPFLQRLEEAGFPATYYLKSPDGELIYHSSECDAVVWPQPKGETAAPSPAICREVGVALAKLHQISSENLPEKRHWLDASYLSDAIEAAVEMYGTERLSKTLKIYESLKNFKPANLPQSIVHGDLDLSTCLFEGEKLTVLIDWQEVGVGAALMDFVATVIGFCFIERWDENSYLGADYYPEFYQALYEGYNDIRPFSVQEKARLNDALQYVGLIQPVWTMLLWQHYHPEEEMVETNTLYWRFGLDKLTLPVF